MFRQLTLRQRLIAVSAPPLAVLAVIAVYAMILGGSSDAGEMTNDIRTLGAVALAAMIMSGLAVALIARSIEDSGDGVAQVVDEFANQRLPLLLDGLRNPGTPAPHLDPIDLSGQDEAVERLGRALTAIQEAAVEVTDEHRSRMQRGLSELVINLARRNQSLLDRQIEFIDELESAEEDPDRLEDLFGLDHLATRMRRNAESLLVVAGAEPPRRRGGPVSVSDIVRVALSEIEDYRHVQLETIDDASIGAQSAIDVAHLMSELLENATQFSPPETLVQVSGAALQDGDYIISVVDHGIGMTREQIDEANEILSDPPDLELGLSRSLGFMVIGRLARRLDITVELNPTDGGGITALVLLRQSLLSSGRTDLAPADQSGRQMKAAIAGADTGPSLVRPLPSDPEPHHPHGRRAGDAPAPAAAPRALSPQPPPAAPPVLPPAAAPPGASAPAPASPPPAAAPVVDKPLPAAQSDALAKLMGVPLGGSLPPAAATPPAKLDDAIPSGTSFESGVASLLGGEAGAEPAEPGRTAAGLVKRDRTKSLAPQSEGRTIPGGGGQAVAASGRSPEEIRDMLAKYRGGRTVRPGNGPAAGNKPTTGNDSGGPS